MAWNYQNRLHVWTQLNICQQLWPSVYFMFRVMPFFFRILLSYQYFTFNFNIFTLSTKITLTGKRKNFYLYFFFTATLTPFTFPQLCTFISTHMSSNQIILGKICISNSSWCSSKPCSIRGPDECNQRRAELDWTHGESFAVGA